MIILHEVLKRLGFPFKVNFSLSKFLWVELTFCMASNILSYINVQINFFDGGLMKYELYYHGCMKH